MGSCVAVNIEKHSDPESTVFLYQVGKCVPFQVEHVCRSTGWQTACPKDFTADRHDGVNDCCGANWTALRNCITSKSD